MSTYPYPTDLLEALHDTDGWADIKPTWVRVDDLRPTQSHVVIERVRELLCGAEPETGDRYPHVVDFDGSLWVHDGHHRYVIELAKSKTRQILARVVRPTAKEATKHE